MGTTINEARQFFRINTDLRIEYRLASATELNSPYYSYDLPTIDPKYHPLLAQFQILDQESSILAKKLANHTNEVAAYFKNIEQKLLLLTKAVLIQNNTNANARLQTMNLSEAGIAFGSDQLFNIGDHLRISLQLPPIIPEIALYARILRIETSTDQPIYDPNYKYWLALEFTKIQPQTSQALARYILYKQTKKDA